MEEQLFRAITIDPQALAQELQKNANLFTNTGGRFSNQTEVATAYARDIYLNFLFPPQGWKIKEALWDGNKNPQYRRIIWELRKNKDVIELYFEGPSILTPENPESIKKVSNWLKQQVHHTVAQKPILWKPSVYQVSGALGDFCSSTCHFVHMKIKQLPLKS